jgi:nucleoside 2-deoxyribosyltransferase
MGFSLSKLNSMNRLKNQRVYLAGAMDRVHDRGATWRDNITPFLEKMGIIIFNPITKPTSTGMEDHDSHVIKTKFKNQKRYDELSSMMKTIRSVDLRLVDISDFLIVNLDLDHYACGTWEELFLCNRSKKPILIHIEQGKAHAPDWLFGTLPHEWFFSNWEELKNYVIHINNDENIEHYNRWRFFDI